MSNDNNHPIIIVGAGPGGLATALQLAHAGFKVKLLERQNYIGGRTSWIDIDGFRFDRGPTFFLYPRILEEIYSSMGLDLFKEIPMKRLDPQYRLVFGSGGHIDATPDIAELERQVATVSPQDALSIRAFMEDNRVKLQRFAPILENEFSSWKQLLTWDMISLLPLLRAHKSLERDLATFFKDERIRLAFSFQSKYLGMSPFQCPSLFTILSFLEYEHGVYHPYGGCANVSNKMAELAQSMGVEICLDEEVQRLDFRGRKVTGVHTKKGSYPCSALVVNADFSRAMQRLVPNHLRPSWTDQKIAKTRYSCSTYMLYLGIKGSVDLPHHLIYFSSDYKGNLENITSKFQLSQDPSFYVQNACVTDPALAPPGCSTLYVLIPVPHIHPSGDWSPDPKVLRAQVFQQLAKVGVPDLEERVMVEHSICPRGWEAMEIHQGATFSMAHTLDQMLFLRPQNRFGDLEGVYLVGGSTHPGSGLPVIYSSSRISTRAILEDFGHPSAHTASTAWSAAPSPAASR